MRIKNQTNWRTDDLRHIFAAVLRRWNKTDDRKVPSKRLRNITVANARWAHSGYAYLNSGTIRIRLPKVGVDVRKVAFLFEHELAHAAGYDHASMGPLNHWKLATTSRYNYVDGMEIREKEKIIKPKPDMQIARYQNAVAALSRWQTKAKRAATGIRTYKAKVRYYEKVLAADGRLAALKVKR